MPKPTKPNPEIIARVRVLVDTLGIPEVGRRLRLADATIARLAGGLNVAEGTILLVEQRLDAAESGDAAA